MSLISLSTVNELTTIFTLIIISYVSYYYYKYFTRRNPLPGPLPLPLIGNIHNLILSGDTAEYSLALQKKYGDLFEIYVGSERHIWLNRSDLIEKLFSSSTKTPFNIRSASEGLDELGITSNGVGFNNDLTSWRFNRKILTQSLMVPSFLRLFVEFTKNSFDEMDQYWENLNQDFKSSSSTSVENIVFDLPNWMKRFTTDTIFPALTGKRSYTLALYYNRLVNSKELKTTIPKTSCDSEEFIEAIRTWLHALQFFYFIPKFLRNYVPPFMFYRQKFLKSMSWTKNEILKIVKETRNELKEGGRASNSDLLTLFCSTNTEMDSKRINNIDEFSRPLTDEEIMYSMFEVLTGGIDTSANSLCFIVYYLSKHPQYKRRLIEEIDGLLGPPNSMTENRLLTLEDIDKLEFCEAVVKETARLMPVAPSVFRQSGSSNELDEVANMKWEKGVTYFQHVHGIHMNKANWKDPEEFNPNRFMKDSSKKIDKNSFIPFGGGLRICPGRYLAMINIKTLLALMYSKYDINLVDMNSPLKKAYSLVNYCVELDVYITKRNA